MAEITSELLEVTVDTDHTVEIDSKLPEVVVDIAKSITVEIQPENYVLTSGGMYTGNMTGATPTWLLNAIQQQLTTGDGNVMSVLDAMQTLLNSVQLGVNQAISQIENTNVSMSALETSLGSRIGSNEAAILDVYATRVTAADAQAIATTAIGTTFGGNIDAYIGNLASVYTAPGSATATNISTLQTSYNDQSARIDALDYVTVDEFGYSLGASKLGTAPDGSIVGWQFTDGTGVQSEFKIKAQNFSISDGTTGYTPFSITGSDINFLGKVSFSSVTGAPSGGSNLLYNSAPMLANETKGWSVGWYNTGIVPTLGAGFDSWRPSGGGSVYAVVPGAPTAGTVFDLAQTTKVPVIGGKWYEASAYASSHRCTSYVTIAWYDSNNAYIGEVGGTHVSGASSGALANWGRSTLLAQAPANAARAHFYVRSAVSGTDPYCFVAFAYLGQAVQGQTVFSDWSEGTSAGVSSGEVVNDINNGNTTTINGGRITTGSIATTQLDALEIKAGNLFIDNTIRSSDFTTIGGAGFRLKSNAAGTSVDPTIYGAYIYGSRLEGSFTNVSSFRVYSTTFINNSGRVYFRDFKYNLTSSVGTHLTSGTFYGEQYGTGYVETRICDSVSSIVEIEVGGSSTDGSSINIQVSVNGGAFSTIFSGQPLSFYRSFIVKYDVPSPYYNTFVFRAYAQTASTAIRHITTTLFNM